MSANYANTGTQTFRSAFIVHGLVA